MPLSITTRGGAGRAYSQLRVEGLYLNVSRPPRYGDRYDRERTVFMQASDRIHWLAAAEPKPPAALLERMRAAMVEASARELDAVSGSPADPRLAAETFAAAALDRLRVVMQAEGGRGTALDLLAADALLTYAYEAAAEAGPEAFDAV